MAAPLAAAVPSLGRLLPEPVTGQGPAPLGDGFERVQLFDGVLSLLVRLSELGPLLLVIEDLHWADRSTRDLLAFLVRTCAPRPWWPATAPTSCTAATPAPAAGRAGPPPRAGADGAGASRPGRAGRAPPGHRRAPRPRPWSTASWPAPRATRSSPRSWSRPAPSGADIGLPDALADVLWAASRPFPELAQEILKVAAVVGRRVGHGLLVAAWPARGRGRAGLRDAVAGQVLVASAATESYRLRHALLQEAVYGDLLPGDLPPRHTYAQACSPPPTPTPRTPASAAELAWHRLASHDLPGGLAGAGLALNGTVFAPMRPTATSPRLELELGSGRRRRGRGRPGRGAGAGGGGGQPGEFRQAVGLAREAVEAIDEEAELRAALAYDRLGSYLLDVEPEGGPDPDPRGDPGCLSGRSSWSREAADPAAGPATSGLARR